ncbi:MAG: aldo/keto reductase, partial [Actinomycetes bacterium]
RKSDDDFTVHLDANLTVAEAIGRVAERHGVPRPAAAAAWTLAFRGVSGAIVGARSAAQVDGWLDAAALHYDDEDLALVAAAIESSGAGDGPTRP